MSRRCPGEHEPTRYDYKPPFPLKWLALCGKVTLVSILLGSAAIGILLLAFGPENVPHLALGVILALMLVPPRVFLFMQDDMDRVSLTGRCPACDIPNPIESPADGESSTSD